MFHASGRGLKEESMRMLVSMLFMGIVSNGGGVQPAELLRKTRDTSPVIPTRPRALPVRQRGGLDESRIVLDPLPWDQEDVPAALLRRFQMAQSFPGRLAFAFYILCQRMRMASYVSAPAAIKRTIDVAASLILLLLLSPLFAIIGLLVKLEDGGPVFFAQTRVGLNGREFKMYKIRSMCMNAEQRLEELLGYNEHSEGVTFKLKDDPRITRVGRWLRKLSMDELPQLYNVLTGSMSLVGPRPPVPREVAVYTLADRRRLSIKPGITCIWQISGRSEIDFSGQVKLDVLYIESQGFLTDFWILLRTLPAVISGRGAS
jgi:lipopolysaccharide/colanic/teichoic acid biosynthesis glycosyltransferase